MFFRVLMAAILALSGAVGGAPGAAAEEAPFSAAAFVENLDRGMVWCVDHRPSDNSCTFVLRSSALTYVSNRVGADAEGVALIELHDGTLIKVAQRFRFFVSGAQLCLKGASVRPDDVRLYMPATDTPFVSPSDVRAQGARERAFQKIIVGVWSEQEATCWSYAYMADQADARPSALSITRYHDGVVSDADAFGAFFETEDLKTLRLRP